MTSISHTRHRPLRPLPRLLLRGTARLRSRALRLGEVGRDAGMTTAEYAIGTVAACAFAAILYRVVTSGAVSDLLSEILGRALHAV